MYVRISAGTRSSARSANARRAAADEARSRWNDDRTPAAQVHGAGGVEERRDLRQPVAAARRRDRGELRADVVGQRAGAHSAHAFEREQAPLQLRPGAAVAADPVRRDDPVARDDQRVAVVGAERSRRARRPGPAGERGELAVGDDLAPGDRPGGRGELALQRRRPLEVDRDVRRTRSARPRGARRSAGTDPARRRHGRVTTRPVAFVLGASLPHWGKASVAASERAGPRVPLGRPAAPASRPDAVPLRPAHALAQRLRRRARAGRRRRRAPTPRRRPSRAPRRGVASRAR